MVQTKDKIWYWILAVSLIIILAILYYAISSRSQPTLDGTQGSVNIDVLGPSDVDPEKDDISLPEETEESPEDGEGETKTMNENKNEEPAPESMNATDNNEEN